MKTTPKYKLEDFKVGNHYELNNIKIYDNEELWSYHWAWLYGPWGQAMSIDIVNKKTKFEVGFALRTKIKDLYFYECTSSGINENAKI